MRTRRNVAAAAGRWSARHRWTAVGLWLLFVVGATLVGGSLGTGQLTSTELSAGESRQAQETLDAAGFQQPSHEVVLVQSDTATVADPAFAAAVTDVVGTLKGRSEVLRVLPPTGAGGTGAVSADKRSALVQFDMTGDGVAAKEEIDPVLTAVEGLRGAHPDVRIEQFGEATFGKAYDDKLNKDYTNAEALSFPITLAILIVAFGTLVAAFLPIVLALTAVTAGVGLLAITSQALHVDANGSSVMTLIGIAVGVDYSLFYIRRFREERQRGRSPQEAVEAAAATSGRAVLISGLAVVIAMAGLFLTGNGIQMGIAEATIVVVLVAVLGSVTVLPALLALLGDKVDKGRVPGLGRLRRPQYQPTGGTTKEPQTQDGRGWDRILSRVIGAPVVSLLVFGGLLVVLSLPAFLLRTSDPGFGDLPTSSMPQLQTYERIQQAFPGSSAPAKVVVSAPDVTAGPVQAGIAAFRAAVPGNDQLRGPVGVEVSGDRTVALLTVGLAGNGTDTTSTDALATLRGSVVPSTLGAVPGVTAKVSGITATSADGTRQLSHSAPLVGAFVLLLTFAIMLMSFRSLTLGWLTLGLNLLSVGTAYGLVVLIFQYGWGSGILGFDKPDGIASWVPLFMFVILFGLSMDYHVFIISRVREAHDRGDSTRDAIRNGIRGSAGTVTSAAVVMVAVAGVFGTLPQLSMKEAGVGMCVAILIDATIIRAVVLPAAMALLGERTWYLPRFLRWVPELSHGEPAEPAAVPAGPDQQAGPDEASPGRKAGRGRKTGRGRKASPGRSAEQEPAAV
ncbi:MAG TPA: MMPL family transporter [Mycobacteriales bacterium]|nr:MMPL family transporter [Mycobacteriales bacterium]